METMTSVVLYVDGMFSVFDALGVEKHLMRDRGIQRVEANFLSGMATVEYSDTEVRLDEIERMIRECGYGCSGECLPEHLRAPSGQAGQ